MNIKKLLGKRIQEVRKSKKLTQEFVSEYIGIETGSLSNIETGKFYPTSENLEKISNALGVKIHELFEFEHCENTKILKNKIIEFINNANDKEIEFLYKIINSLTEFKSK